MDVLFFMRHPGLILELRIAAQMAREVDRGHYVAVLTASIPRPGSADSQPLAAIPR